MSDGGRQSGGEAIRIVKSVSRMITLRATSVCEKMLITQVLTTAAKKRRLG